MTTPPFPPQQPQPQAPQPPQHQPQPQQQAYPSQPPMPPHAQPPYPPPPAPDGTPGRRKNTVGLVALIAAVVGFVFACIPGALIIGWILLPIAFILGLVGLFLAGKRRGTSIAAVIIAVIGTVVGFVVFATAVSDAVDDAFGGSDVSVTGPATAADGAAPAAGAGTAAPTAGDQGTRTSPYPLGSTVTSRDWKVTINSVSLDADDAIAAENPFNDAPAAGTQYLMANVTITYTGDDPQGSMPMATIDYVTADGNTVHSFDAMVVEPDALDDVSPLYEGASTTGNVAFAVPSASAAQGTLAVQATPLADKVFVAVQ